MMDGIEQAQASVGRAFLLRIWRTTKDGELRVSVRDVDTGEQRVFVDVQLCAEWLRHCLD